MDSEYYQGNRALSQFLLLFVPIFVWWWTTGELCLGVTALTLGLAFFVPWAVHVLKVAHAKTKRHLEEQRVEARRQELQRRDDDEARTRRQHAVRMAELEAALKLSTPVPPPPPPPPTREQLLAELQHTTEAELTRLEAMKGMTPDEKITVRNQIIDDYLTKRAAIVG